jgi:hypothetical protein
MKWIVGVRHLYLRLWCKPREYKNLETHNEIDDKPEKPKIKFVIYKPWPKDNLVPKNQKCWKMNLGLLIIENQKTKMWI